jgi:chaperonin GroES
MNHVVTSVETDQAERRMDAALDAPQPQGLRALARSLFAAKVRLNAAGVQPVEFKVLVKPSSVEVDPALARAKAAGLQLPPDVLERELMAQIVAELVAAGGNAFEDWRGPIPKAGDKVLIAKYAGITIKGADGEEYRMLNDKDISGIINREGVSRL